MDERLVQTYTETVQLPIHGHYLRRFLLRSDGRRSAESYSDKPIETIVKEPGVVPPDSILVMEGVAEIVAGKEAPPPGFWDRFSAWVKERFSLRGGSGTIPVQPQAVVLWDDTPARPDANNQNSYLNALSVFGFRVTKHNYREFTTGLINRDTVLVVPRAAAAKLNPKQVDSIQALVGDGGRLVLDGPSRLSQALGVKTERRALRIHTVEDTLYANKEYSTREAEWKPPAEVVRFSVPSQLLVYAQDKVSELPMAVLARHGRGRFLYLGARLDPTTPLGYTRYPYFVHYILEGFGIKLPLQRSQLELYFDPGSTKRADIDRLVEDWRKLGVRAIYAGAYQFWPKWSYSYGHLIDICHRNGILVYAWFELPHVSVKFWEEHPEWRAKTASGEDGQVGWRYHMDLDIPECQDAAFDFVEDLLKKYPWDGVNVAELNTTATTAR